MTIYIKFILDNSDEKIFEFDESITVESMLKSFLEKTNSKINLDPQYVTFMYNCIILNNYNNLHKKISEVFKGKGHVRIKIINKSKESNSVPLADPFITFNDYNNYFIFFHRKLSEFFKENYSSPCFDSTYKNIFINFLKTEDIREKEPIINCVNKMSGEAYEFVRLYTGNNSLYYILNKWLRKCDEKEYDKIKYFAGPFSYSLYQYEYNESKTRANCPQKLYRKMTIKSDDFEKYKNNIGKVICYPTFISTTEMDVLKYGFSMETFIGTNGIKVVLIIEYKCNNESYPIPFINVSYISTYYAEKEYIFPPFSFFRIEKIEEGTGNHPNIIYMTVPNKRNLIEFEIKKGKTICYNKELNELYSS